MAIPRAYRPRKGWLPDKNGWLRAAALDVSRIAILALPLTAAVPQVPPPQAWAQTTPPAAAEIDARRRAGELDARFIDLKAAASQTDGDRIVAEIWQLWLKSGDTEIDALVDRGVANMQFGNLASALAIFDDVVRRKPEFAEGWNKRATVLYMMDEYDRSLADCAEVLAREPRHFGALAGMGLMALARDDAKAALAAFRRALAVNPYLHERRELIPELERRAGERPL